jgi:hypothetical protein
VFRVLHRVVKLVNYAQGVRQPVSVRVSRARREGGQLERRRAVSAYFVSCYQGSALYGGAAGVEVVRAVY